MYDFSIPSNDPRNLLEAATLIERVFDSRFEPDNRPLETNEGPMGQFPISTYIETQRPQAMLFASTQRRVMAISGINGARDALTFFNSYFTSLVTRGVNAPILNGMTDRWTDSLKAVWPDAFLDANDFTIIGHSMGGTVAYMMAWYIRRLHPLASIFLITFGMPKFSSEAYRRNQPRLSSIRIMNYGDLIPYLLPSLSQSPLFNALIPFPHFVAASQTSHPAGGVRVAPGSVMIRHEEPWGVSTPLELTIQQTIDAFAGANIRHHLASEYKSVMQQIVDSQNPQPAVINQPQPPVELRTHGIPLPELEREWRANRQVEINPQTFAPTNPDAGVIKTVKISGLWYVTVRGLIVYNATSKRDARGVAHSMRAMRTQIGQNPTGYVLPGELVEQLADPGAFLSS